MSSSLGTHQSVADFVACQHSRDTFARRRLGDRAEAFDRELTALLRPHAVNGHLHYRIGTRIAWGRLALRP